MARPTGRSALAITLVASLVAALGCTQLGSTAPPLDRPAPTGSPASSSADAAVYSAARDARTAHLEREVARLRADLAQAEEAMVTIESGLRGQHTRADAVSTVADARIAVDRAARSTPWRREEIEEARAKLTEAERQLRAGHSGSALFFASRAARIAETLNEEAYEVARARDMRLIETSRANLRSGPSTDDRILAVLDAATPVFPQRRQGEWLLVRTPSGPIGWLHDSVLE